MRSIRIGNKMIGEGEPTFVVTEVGSNHENDREMAKKMIQKAKEAGADAVKFQIIIPETLVTKTAPRFWDYEGQPEPGWFSEGTQFEEYRQVHTFTEQDYRMLAEVAEKAGIIFMASAFDTKNIDLLDELGVPAFKIASCDITNFPFLKYVAKKAKPIILSTGASTIGEIEEAVQTIRSEGNKDIILLHCILNYPTADEEINLRMMTHLQRVFPDLPVGLSDHTIPDPIVTITTAAVVLGAKVIEKHYTLDKSLPGNDHFLSVDFEDLKRMVNNFRIVEKALGLPFKKPLPSEGNKRRLARRSIISAVDIPKGTVITREMLTTKRPGIGIAPKFLDIVVGKKAAIDINEDTVLTFDMI